MVVALIAVSAIFVNIMDTTVVNVALPSIAHSFRLPPSLTEASIVAFIVTLAVTMPLADRLARRIGLRLAFICALLAFTGASALCAASWSLAALTAFRCLQGAAAGLLNPIAMTMLLTTFGPADRMRVGRMLMLPTTVAPATGPLVGGLLTEHAGWRWVFLVNVPVGVLALALCRLVLQPVGDPPARQERFAGTGFLLGGGGLAAVLFGLAAAGTEPWPSPVVWLPLAAGTGALGLFAVTERRSTSPLLDFSALGDRLFMTATLAQTFALATFLGVLYLMPLMLQGHHHLTAFQSGLCTAWEAVGVLSGTQLVAHLFPRFGPKPLLITGCAGIAASSAALAFTVSGPAWASAPLMFGAGFAMSFIFLSAETAAFTHVRSMGSAAVLFNVLMQAGSAVGVCVAALPLGKALASSSPASFRGGLLCAACFGMAGILATTAMRNRDAAPVMVPAGKRRKMSARQANEAPDDDSEALV